MLKFVCVVLFCSYFPVAIWSVQALCIVDVSLEWVVLFVKYVGLKNKLVEGTPNSDLLEDCLSVNQFQLYHVKYVCV